jgi:ABC-2 type transport system permease protein
MTATAPAPSHRDAAKAPPPPGRVLRRLFLTLFLRGRTSRGLQKETAPKSVGQKLALTLGMYALVGAVAFMFRRQPVFALSIYLHAMTFVFLGMFVAASAGEVLFNKEEADILLHRPVAPRSLLWAKIGVLVQVSLWLAGAFNLVGFFVGIGSPDGGWRFPVTHAVSTSLEALFCTGCVVLVYQLCLRWFGRERLDSLMTAAQVLVAIVAVLGGQLVPQLMSHFVGKSHLSLKSWWIALLPPAWFAGFDDLLAGSGAVESLILAGVGVAALTAVLWLAFGKLAGDYKSGLQNLNETSSTRPTRRSGRRWIDVLVKVPPLRWWLRDPIARASFLLTAAYLVRDRDVKLRVYPGLAPILVFPFMVLIQGSGQRGDGSGFFVAFVGGFLGLMPLLGLNLLRYSQQWQAADLFRVAPMAGPAPLCHGARRAVLCFLTLPLLVAFGVSAWLLSAQQSQLALMLPGLIALPVYALVPCLRGKAVPLSLPTEEAKSANRGLSMIGATLVSTILSALASWAWTFGWFNWLLLVELILVLGLYALMRAAIEGARWESAE